MTFLFLSCPGFPHFHSLVSCLSQHLKLGQRAGVAGISPWNTLSKIQKMDLQPLDTLLPNHALLPLGSTQIFSWATCHVLDSEVQPTDQIQGGLNIVTGCGQKAYEWLFHQRIKWTGQILTDSPTYSDVERLPPAPDYTDYDASSLLCPAWW